MRHEEQLKVTPVEDTGVMTQPCVCVICQYDLRTLRSTTNCPECGTPVARSLQGNALHDANPAWVRGLAWGTLLMAVAPLLYLMVLGFLVLASGRLPDDSPLYAGLALGPLLVYTVGLWLATAREAVETLRPNRTRQAARWVGVASFVATAVGYAIGRSFF